MDFFKDNAAKLVTAVTAGLILAWFAAGPQSKVSLTVDWMQVNGPMFPPPADLNTVLNAAGVSSKPGASSDSLTGNFAVAEIVIANPSSVTAKEIDVQVANTVLIYDPKVIPALYRPASDRTIHLDKLLPNDQRTIYLAVNGFSFGNSIDRISAIVDGVAIPITKAKMSDLAWPGMHSFVQTAHSGEDDHSFRRMATTCSDR